MLLQTISSQRPITNSTSPGTSRDDSPSLFNAYEGLTPSIAPAAVPPHQQIPQTRSESAKPRYKPAPNNGTRMPYHDRFGKILELNESVKNSTVFSPNGLMRRGKPLDILKKMVKDSSYNSNIHNKTNPSQGDDTIPYRNYYNKNDPIKRVKNVFQQPVNATF